MTIITENKSLSGKINSVMEQNCMSETEQENLTQYISYH